MPPKKKTAKATKKSQAEKLKSKAARAPKGLPKPQLEKPEPVRELGEPAKGEQTQAPEHYWEAVGRRKTAMARVRLLTKGEKGLFVNTKPVGEYFPYLRFQYIATEALAKMKSLDRFQVLAKVQGGGPNAQAEAIRHGIARALVLFNPDFRKRLKRAGFLTRDPRMKERKKFGLKGARRAPQWAKR